VAKQKSVVSVHLDIAALCWATRGLQTKDQWAEWGQSFVESLATRKPELNEFAASLMKEVEEFRAAEAERIRVLRLNSKDSGLDVQVQTVHSVQESVLTVSKSDSQSVSQSEKTLTQGKAPSAWVRFKEPISRLFGAATSIATEQKQLRLVGELAKLEATPEQLAARVAHYRLCWPDVACTLQGVVNNWNQIPHLKPKYEKKKEAVKIDWADEQ
jgi:hypothetical protein